METLFILLVGMLLGGAGIALGIVARDEALARQAHACCSPDEIVRKGTKKGIARRSTK